MPKSYEDELQLLIDKVEGADDKSWEEMVSELGLSVHPDSLRKSFNGGRYSGYAVAKYYNEKLYEYDNIEEDDFFLDDYALFDNEPKMYVQIDKEEFSRLISEMKTKAHRNMCFFTFAFLLQIFQIVS